MDLPSIDYLPLFAPYYASHLIQHLLVNALLATPNMTFEEFVETVHFRIFLIVDVNGGCRSENKIFEAVLDDLPCYGFRRSRQTSLILWPHVA